jgi:hypothetical protein
MQKEKSLNKTSREGKNILRRIHSSGRLPVEEINFKNLLKNDFRVLEGKVFSLFFGGCDNDQV